MNLLFDIRTSIFIVSTALSFGACAYPGESIALDPATGDYIITYWDEEEPASLEKGKFFPATKIDPTVQSRFRANEKGEVIYRYKVHSSGTSRQIIGTLRFILQQNIIGSQDWPKVSRGAVTEAQLIAVHDANAAALATPDGWSGRLFARNGYRISWHPSHKPERGIFPGSTQDGFGFVSQALPGLGMAQLEGDHPMNGWAGPGPTPKSAIKAQLEQLEQNNFVSRLAAVPAIAVPTPFDASLLLDRIRTEMQTWPSKQLLDPAYAAQLDRYMVAAAEAYRLNNAKAGKEHIKTIRKMLAKEHHDLDHDDEGDEDTAEHRTATRLTIDRLAARVLDFDLRYVLKRMEPEEDETHH